MKLKNLKLLSIVLYLSGAITLLNGCGFTLKKEQSTSVEQSMIENPASTIDDLFMEKVANPEELQKKIINLEKMIQIIEKIDDLGLDIKYEKREDVTRESINDIDLDEVLQFLSSIEDTESLSLEEQEKLYLQLNEIYQKIGNYVIQYGQTDLIDFNMELSKTIVLSATEYEGDTSNVKIYDEDEWIYLGKKDRDGYAIYKNDSYENRLTFDNSTSRIFDLVHTAIDKYYDDFGKTETDEDFQKRIKYFKEQLEIIIEAINNEYEVDQKGFFQPDNYIKVKK